MGMKNIENKNIHKAKIAIITFIISLIIHTLFSYLTNKSFGDTFYLFLLTYHLSYFILIATIFLFLVLVSIGFFLKKNNLLNNSINYLIIFIAIFTSTLVVTKFIPTSTDEISCIKDGGSFDKWASVDRCNKPLKDGGKICHDTSECEDTCIADQEKIYALKKEICNSEGWSPEIAEDCYKKIEEKYILAQGSKELTGKCTSHTNEGSCFSGSGIYIVTKNGLSHSFCMQ